MKNIDKKKLMITSGISLLIVIIITVCWIITDGFGMVTQSSQNGDKLVNDITPTQGANIGHTASSTPKASVTPEVSKRPPNSLVKINIISVDRELDEMVKEYAKEHWDFRYEINYISDELVYSTQDLVNLITDSLKNKSSSLDLYCVPYVYNDQFIRGEYADNACPYSNLGIDMDTDLSKAELPPYTIKDGTNQNGKIVALPYMANASVFLYRRSVAKKVWGTDDPDKITLILGGGTENWDKFLEAAKTLKQKGYYIVPGYRDLSYQIEMSDPYANQGGGYNGQINPSWYSFMDISKKLYEYGYITDTQPWTNPWYDVWRGKGDKIFGLITLTDFYEEMDMGDTAGDWAVCMPPFKMTSDPYTGIMVNKNSPNKDLLGPLVEWITLDSTDSGFQHSLANGTFRKGEKLSVMSGTVLKNTDSSRDFLGGQNINPIINEILQSNPGKLQSYGYDKSSYVFDAIMNETDAYIKGVKNKEEAIAAIKAAE